MPEGKGEALELLIASWLKSCLPRAILADIMNFKGLKVAF
jgi:hypothetical protein